MGREKREEGGGCGEKVAYERGHPREACVNHFPALFFSSQCLFFGLDCFFPPGEIGHGDY